MTVSKPKSFTARDYSGQPMADYPDCRSTILRHQKHKLIASPQSLADVSGPAFGHMQLGKNDHDLIINHATSGESAIGERILVHGHVLDEGAQTCCQCTDRSLASQCGRAVSAQKRCLFIAA